MSAVQPNIFGKWTDVPEHFGALMRLVGLGDGKDIWPVKISPVITEGSLGAL